MGNATDTKNRIEQRLAALGIDANQLVLRLAGSEPGVLGAWERVVEALHSWLTASHIKGTGFPREVTVHDLTEIAGVLECEPSWLLRIEGRENSNASKPTSGGDTDLVALAKAQGWSVAETSAGEILLRSPKEPRSTDVYTQPAPPSELPTEEPAVPDESDGPPDELIADLLSTQFSLVLSDLSEQGAYNWRRFSEEIWLVARQGHIRPALVSDGELTREERGRVRDLAAGWNHGGIGVPAVAALNDLCAYVASLRSAAVSSVRAELDQVKGLLSTESALWIKWIAPLAGTHDPAVARERVADRLCKAESDLLAIAEATGIVNECDGHASTPGPTKRIVQEVVELRDQNTRTRDRLQAIVDEHVSKQLYISVEELLGIVEASFRARAVPPPQSLPLSDEQRTGLGRLVRDILSPGCDLTQWGKCSDGFRAPYLAIVDTLVPRIARVGVRELTDEETLQIFAEAGLRGAATPAEMCGGIMRTILAKATGGAS